MKTLTKKEVQELPRPLLEVQFIRLQTLIKMQSNRVATLRQRAVLIEQHVKRLVDACIPHISDKDGGK